jgi:uncharacterized RDD family membrane protein YckC
MATPGSTGGGSSAGPYGGRYGGLPGGAVVVGEAVALDLPPAALPSRMVAAFVDVALQALLLGLLLTLAFAVFPGYGAAAAAITLVVVVLVGLPTASETLWRGKTPGKAALGLRVVRDDGGPIGLRHAFTRALTGALLEKPGLLYLTVVVPIVVSLFSARGKRLGDLLAGTYVVNERVSLPAATPILMPAPLAGWAAGLDLGVLPDGLLLTTRQFLQRSAGMTPAARATVAERLLAAYPALPSPGYPPPPAEVVLAALVAERRRREELRLGLTPDSSAWHASAWLSGRDRKVPAPAYGGRPPRGVDPA